ncbi:MAG: YcaO-like family protein [Haloarculaceae archaeon]
MSVGVVGSGSAVEAVTAALADASAAVVETDADAIDETDVAVVTGQAGASVFETANRTARRADRPWLAVELGGVGGYPVVDAAVSGFAPETGCYACLADRVGSNVDPDSEPHSPPDPSTARFAGALAGRLTVAHLDGDDAVFGTVIEVPHARRSFLSVPHCACGTEPDWSLPGEHVDRPLADALGRAERALDERVGIVGEVGEAESYPAPYYLARLCDTSGFSDATAAANAAGVDADWNAAFMKALGEGLERYCAGVYRIDRLTEATVDAVADAVSPSSFVRRGDPDVPDDEPLSWVPAEDLATGRAVSVPAEFVYYPPPERRFRPAITTGLGLGNSGVEAVLSGLYEVIERDAAMLSWYSTFDPLELAVGDDDAYRTLARRAGVEDLETTALLLTQDVDVPVVAVAVHRESFPKLALGSAASLDPVDAARTALAEALQNWVELRGMGPEDAADADGAIGRYATDSDPFWDAMEPSQQVPAASIGPDADLGGRAELEAVVERVTNADCDAVAARTTTRDVAALGFEAVRVLVPAAQPLFFGDAYFGDRAETVPATLGFEPRLDRRHHPFP